MALPVTCPGCSAVYPVPENLIGKTIRCKKCGEMMPVSAPAKPAAVAASARASDDDEAPRSRPSRRRDEENEDARPTPKSTRRPAAVADDDEDDAPRPKSKRRPMDDDDDETVDGKKSKLPLILGGLGAAVLLGGSIAAFVLLGGREEKPNNTNQQVAAVQPGPASDPTPKPETKPDTKPDSKPETRPETKPETKPPTETKVEPTPEVKPETKPPTPPPTSIQITGGRGGSDRVTSSSISPEAYFNGNISTTQMNLCTTASVFIKTETDSGTSTGSGWFGVAPGLVFTNAHVLDMKAPNTSEPKKLTFFLNAGTPQQREIAHSKIKVLAVDRDIDLAVLQVIGESDLPSPLKVKPSAELQLGQSVYTVGYPLGYILSQLARSKKEPEVTVRKTSFIGISTNEYGQLRRVKLESGVNSGNSGGPVIDASGEVTAVVVAITNVPGTGNAISLCVPTEYVLGLVAGRVANLEYGIPYNKGDKVHVPVTANILNPLKRAITVRVRSWVGDADAKYRPPSMAKPAGEAGDAGEQDVELKYNDKTMTATGELVYPQPPAGRTYWAQGYFVNGLATNALPGVKLPISGPPVDRVPANLTAALKPGTKRVVTMSNSSSLSEDFEGEGESKADRTMVRRSLKVNELVVAPDKTDMRQTARLQFQFDSFDMALEHDGMTAAEIPKKDKEEMNRFFKAAAAFGLINRFGEMYSYTLSINGVNDPLANLIVGSISHSALEAMQATSIPMPNRTMNPGETWETTKDVRWTLFERPTISSGVLGSGKQQQKQRAREYKYRDQITYTYLGTRERGGRKEAVVTILGKSVPAAGTKQAENLNSITGGVKGIVWVELDTGVVVKADIEKEFDMDTSREGAKRRLSGVNTYKMERGNPQ